MLGGKSNIFLKLSILCVGIFIALFVYRSKLLNHIDQDVSKQQIQSFQEGINVAEIELNRGINRITKGENVLQVSRPGFDYLLYVKDTLSEWSTNQIPVDNQIKNGSYSKISFLKNGWYLTRKEHRVDTVVVGLFKIKSEYQYQNRFLIHAFDKSLLQKDLFAFSHEKIDSTSIPINLIGNQTGFYLQPKEAISHSKIFVIDCLLIFSFICLFYFFFRNFFKRHLTQILLFLIVLAVRIFLLYTNYPTLYFDFGMFDPIWFASSWFSPSFGDYLINTMLFYWLVFLLTRSFAKTVFKYSVTSVLINIGLLFWILWQVKSLVANSSFELNITQITSFTIYSYLAYLCISIYIGSLWHFFKTYRNSNTNTSTKDLLYFSISILTTVLLLYFNVTYLMLGIPWAISLFVLASFDLKSNHPKQTLTVFNFLIINTIFICFCVTHFLSIKQRSTVEFIAQELKQKQDPSFEFNALNYEASIVKYTTETLFDYSKEDIDVMGYKNLISDLYFSKFLSKYEIKVYVCNDKSVLFSTQANPQSSTYFNDIIKTANNVKGSSVLYNTHKNSDKEEYILKIKANKKMMNPYSVFITFNSKSYKDIIGFPSLLSEQNSTSINTELSYAYFKNENLSSKFGSFIYPTKLGALPLCTENEQGSMHQYHHYSIKEQDQTIVVTYPQTGIRDYISVFSSLLMFFCLCAALVVVFRFFLQKNNQQQSIALNIQLFLLGLLFFSVLSITIGTYFTTKSEFSERNNGLLQDKLRSILFEVEHKVGSKDIQTIESDKAYLEKILNKFSNVFYSDINLFNLSGDLIASSASTLYNKGLISEKMHPIAYQELKTLDMPHYIQNESIGKMEYLSAYIPVINKKGSLIAYLNLPYFIKQQEFESQWGGFLSSILNIYTLLLMVLIFASIFLGNLVVSPLRNVKEMLEGIDASDHDQSVQYEGRNEIGDFVKVYNKRVAELQEKSIELVETQKQVAWREMAKQVAHEIKNPLTPMKLSVQHLMRSLQVKEEGESQLSSFGNRMVEQIEVLANIATEFSNFAEMPKANLQEVNLSKIVKDLLVLNDSGQSDTITFKSNIESNLWAIADKEQMMRVMQNIIKNAMQAISTQDQKGEILIEAKIATQQTVKVSVTDNGPGIPTEIKTKIFNPNFTTKSSGKGLGLAMCKKIIEQHNGEIGFESDSIQTKFWFLIPRKNAG